jgi:hypothetical protein
MKLFINKEQTKALLGGINFELKVRVELTNNEAELVKKYQAEKETLLKKEIKIPLTGKSLILNLTIGSLILGQTFKCGDISEIIEYEKNVKESCEVFKTYLEVMKNFGGQEVIEFGG